MKKVAVLIRGKIRPGHREVYNEIKNVDNRLKQQNIEYEIYLSTWHGRESLKVLNDDNRNLITHSILINEPSEEECLDKLKTCSSQHINGPEERKRRINSYRMFYSNLYSIKTINFINEYDLIFHLRTDMIIHSLTVDFNKVDSTAYHSSVTCNWGGVCDWIGLASPRIMEAAWNYQNLATLNELFKNSKNPEMCLHKIMTLNNVIDNKINFGAFNLITNRDPGFNFQSLFTTPQ